MHEKETHSAHDMARVAAERRAAAMTAAASAAAAATLVGLANSPRKQQDNNDMDHDGAVCDHDHHDPHDPHDHPDHHDHHQQQQQQQQQQQSMDIESSTTLTDSDNTAIAALFALHATTPAEAARTAQVLHNAYEAEIATKGDDPYTYRPRRPVCYGSEYQVDHIPDYEGPPGADAAGALRETPIVLDGVAVGQPQQRQQLSEASAMNVDNEQLSGGNVGITELSEATAVDGSDPQTDVRETRVSEAELMNQLTPRDIGEQRKREIIERQRLAQQKQAKEEEELIKQQQQEEQRQRQDLRALLANISIDDNNDSGAGNKMTAIIERLEELTGERLFLCLVSFSFFFFFFPLLLTRFLLQT